MDDTSKQGVHKSDDKDKQSENIIQNRKEEIERIPDQEQDEKALELETKGDNQSSNNTVIMKEPKDDKYYSDHDNISNQAIDDKDQAYMDDLADIDIEENQLNENLNNNPEIDNIPYLSQFDKKSKTSMDIDKYKGYPERFRPARSRKRGLSQMLPDMDNDNKENEMDQDDDKGSHHKKDDEGDDDDDINIKDDKDDKEDKDGYEPPEKRQRTQLMLRRMSLYLQKVDKEEVYNMDPDGGKSPP